MRASRKLPHDPVLSTERLTIGYRRSRRPDVVVAKGLNLALHPGELVCLLGPNGAGKTTLMRTLAGLQPALAGAVTLDGASLPALRPRQVARRLSVVLTEPVDVGNLTGRGLTALGRHPYTDWTGGLSPEDWQIVDQALRAVGAEALAERPVLELSDGERQKILIARALAQEPLVMLLDEPTAFLDLPRRVEIMAVLHRLAQEEGRAVLLSTHDLDLALRTADRLWLLGADGTFHTGGPEELVLNGVFERVFASEGVAFDPYTGSFRMVRSSSGVVHLVGDGLASLWTARALERLGYQVHSGDAQGQAAFRLLVEEDA
ncbi:MAG: ABC transporter ATP-binding protein, partial [Caldilineae bacterium]